MWQAYARDNVLLLQRELLFPASFVLKKKKQSQLGSQLISLNACPASVQINDIWGFLLAALGLFCRGEARVTVMVTLKRHIESQNHRIVGVGRDLCGSSSPTLLPKQGHLQQYPSITKTLVLGSLIITFSSKDCW